ncbi:MAG: FMN-binding protein [bacterium]|nr:FMN-binding protein [bacterium]
MKILKFVALISLVAALGFNYLQRLKPQGEEADLAREKKALSVVMPGEGISFSDKKGRFPLYEAYRIDPAGKRQLVGICFTTTDLVPEERGYAGPIKIMLGLDPAGKITGLEILEHTETPSYVEEIYEPSFKDQFKGKGINDPLEIGYDLDGITRATITSEAIARSIKKGVLQAAGDRLGLKPKAHAAPKYQPGRIIINLAGLAALFLVALTGFLIPKKWLRYLALAFALIFLGFIKNSPLSTVNIVNIITYHLPLLIYNPFFYLLIGFILVTTLLWGRIYCGFFCPFGAIQEFISKWKKSLPAMGKGIRQAKYFLLWAALMSALLIDNANVAGIEPFNTLFSRTGGKFHWILLGIVLIAALFDFRFWCKYLCPVGVVLGLCSRLSLFRFGSRGDCGSCRLCVEECKVQAIEKTGATVKVNPVECIACNECRIVCPKGIIGLRIADCRFRIRKIGVVHRVGHWINFVVVKLARHYGRASSATTSKQIWSSAIGRNDEQGRKINPKSKIRNPKSEKRWLSFLLFVGSLTLMLLILGENIYQSQRPPAPKYPVVNVEAVKERIKDAGLSPREAMYYKVIRGNQSD